ncbi:MAG: protein translocase subunit SecF [Acutalibacteraceae bacterium]
MKIKNFIGKSKVFFGISLGIFLVGIICNIVFGVKLDIQFTGGAIVEYAYTGQIDETELKNFIQEKTEQQVTFNVSKNLIAGEENSDDSYKVSVQFAGDNAISLDTQKNLTAALQEKYPDNSFVQNETKSVESSMGWRFFAKCITAVAVACALMVLYVTFRFKKISGLSAGMMALVALFHDVLMVYFTFVILQMPIDSNFIAVVLMILGYSLNDTIVIYDRVRENRALEGASATAEFLYNKSASQVLKRTICTSITTLTAIGCVYAVSVIFQLDSVTTFALPMMIGVISGCYSSICVAGPLWVMWQNHKKKKA